MLLPVWDAIQRGLDGQRFLVVWPVAQVARRWVERLSVLGLPTPFVLGLYDGPSAPLPLPATHLHVLRPGPLPPRDPDDSLFEQWQRAVRALPASALDAIQRWDPEGTAVVLVPPAAELTEVAGRRVFGGTPPIRSEIENKVRVDALFSKLGIPTAPHAVVPLARADTTAATLDQGHGTVWAGDNTTTIEAGAKALARVHSPATRARAHSLFAGRCHTVRIQPFLPGVPCSIQGICTPDGVALTRPTEMLVLHAPTTGEFFLVGMATTWDPPTVVTRQLREMAHTVGQHLASAHSWRGGFSVDAIAAPDGTVWPTEVNARMSAGLAMVDGLLPGPSLEFVERLLREGLPIGVTAARLEQWWSRPLRARRHAHVRLKGLPIPDTPQTIQDALPHAILRWEREGSQGVLKLELDPTRTPRGIRVAPIVEQALQLAHQHWKLPVEHWRAA